MKQLTCEMCGGTDLIKQDGVFVCQNCGMKYSAEDAKKMMVEVDNTKRLANLYERARKSLEINDIDHISEYYKQILDENPNDWEAYFYSYLYEFPTFTNAQAASVAKKIGNAIPAAYDMALENCDIEEASKRIKTITEMGSNRLVGIALAGTGILREYEADDLFKYKSSAEKQVQLNMYIGMYSVASDTVMYCIYAYNLIENKLEDLLKSNSINEKICKECLLYMRRGRYEIATMQFHRPGSARKERLIKGDAIQEYAQKINELDPNFEVPSLDDLDKSLLTDSSGGCYVATAVYGSYDCPQVWTLRRYRDYTLAETWCGRIFIKLYYAVSPTLVRKFGNREWFKKMWRGRLDNMVSKLQAEGYASTPYEDKVW